MCREDHCAIGLGNCGGSVGWRILKYTDLRMLSALVEGKGQLIMTNLSYLPTLGLFSWLEGSLFDFHEYKVSFCATNYSIVCKL